MYYSVKYLIIEMAVCQKTQVLFKPVAHYYVYKYMHC